MASGATCIQRLDGSRDSAIHTKYRILLRSSSMREPRYPLPRVFFIYRRSTGPSTHAADGARGAGYRFNYSLAFSASGFVGRPHTRWARAPGTGEALVRGFDNDPSAGSPTKTLLRLVLPLNDKVQWTSRDVAGSKPPTSPRSKQFIESFNR
ncbi:hypothetical protein CQW23_35169 [Capsicum baccatum]|uniref:Uncharacterized protein n=1 Tax=Capsicum baccatum TaxID=33114 RepID=A0A2G2UWQ6_CAPBA|nr:hypothetical protein CQW23_35169 [Capsicum baccatum]